MFSPSAVPLTNRPSIDVAGSDRSPLAGVPSERLEADLCQLAADLAAGTARWLALVAECDRRRIWERWECRSMANWLVWHVGISLITARQYVLVAHKLEDYPLLAAEFAAGRVSYSRVRALCRFITPESEVDLVRLARFTVAPQLERMAAAFERVERQRNPGDAGDQSDRRDLMLIQEDEGTWIIRGRLPADLGAVLSNAMQIEMARQRSNDSAASQKTGRHEIGENDSAASLFGRPNGGTPPSRRAPRTGRTRSSLPHCADRTDSK